MNYAHARPQGSRRVSQDESCNPSPQGKDRRYPRCKAGKVLGVHRIGPCQLPAKFICWFSASAVKWL